ncbi:Hypothetical predicted protein [Mytilus galloprovincialis]|uniref:Death domain-containing protein n=1 Tax=Mytilus galloprovincialis TaxID=29158 RepID=A0A8B6BYU3_MYTGA|nr:Hypothetical predicted protein [Mytilus galloprovincialis]
MDLLFVLVYLMHWANSILTYCKTSKTGFPRLMFVATHKDALRKEDVEKWRRKHICNLTALFENHPGKNHIQFNSLIFVNAKDPHDPEVAILKDELVRCAVNNPRWGEKMPTAWVPLELELMQQAERGVNILTREQLTDLNAQNKTMVLDSNQLETFLKVQHSLGRIIYFGDVHLRNYIVIQPLYMIKVLSSIITHQQFWPSGKEFTDVLTNLNDTGILSRKALFQIWSQKKCEHILPFGDYMIDMLQHLDIIVEQKRSDTSEIDTPEKATHFLVPCLITKHNTTTFLQRWCTDEYSIHLAYKFINSVIPPALTYRFLGSFLTIGKLKIYRHKTMIFTDLAVVSIDEKHSVAVRAEDDRLIVSLIHSSGKKEIVPTIASSVQECLTASIHRITEFYSLAMDDEQKLPDMTNLREYPFKIEFGVQCLPTETRRRSQPERPSICFFHHSKMPCDLNRTYKCSIHEKRHDVRSLKCWFADKIQEEDCYDRCTGIGTLLLERAPSDQHLMRLAKLLGIEECRQVAITLGLSFTEWDKLRDKHTEPDDLNFMALRKWKESTTGSILRDLIDPLIQLSPKDTFPHRLCQATRTMELKTKLDKKILQKSPSNEELESISNHIGASAMALGVELGLNAPELEAIDVLHKRKLIQKTRKILKQWKTNDSSHTFLVLAKALERIGKGKILEEFEN